MVLQLRVEVLERVVLLVVSLDAEEEVPAGREERGASEQNTADLNPLKSFIIKCKHNLIEWLVHKIYGQNAQT